MIKNLQNEAMQFNIFCSNKDLDGTTLQSVLPDEWLQYNDNTKVWYSSNDNILPVLKIEIKKQQPSFLYIVGLYDWNYNFKPLLQIKHVNKIISVKGMLHPGALLQKSFKKKIYLLFWKLRGWHKKNIFQVSNNNEKEFVQKVFGKSTQIAIAANFPLMFPHSNKPNKKAGKLKLISVALISAMKNHLLILRALKKCFFQIEYNIYGPVKNNNYWQQCLTVINELPSNIVLKVHGAVPPSAVEKALSQNHVFILPSKSENFGHSMIEALSSGCPVITSNATVWNNLKTANAGINVDVDKEEELINAINFFAKMEQDEFEKWSFGANQYAKDAVNINEIKKQYKELFELNEV